MVVPRKDLVWPIILQFLISQGFPDDKAMTSESLIAKFSPKFDKPGELLDDYSKDSVSPTHFQSQENKGRYLTIRPEILISLTFVFLLD